jgi:hypothetical protein
MERLVIEAEPPARTADLLRRILVEPVPKGARR